MRYSLIIFVLAFNIAFSQSVKIVGMGGWTSIKNDKDFPTLGDKQSVVTAGLGVDLLEREKYYLSNEIGYTQLGGKEENPTFKSPHDYISKKWGYLYVSSVFRYNPLMLGNGFFFVGAGPSASVRISKEGLEDTFYKDGMSVKRFVLGLKGEVGYMYNFGKYRLGVVGSYTFNTPMAKSDYLSWISNPIFLGGSLGFSL